MCKYENNSNAPGECFAHNKPEKKPIAGTPFEYVRVQNNTNEIIKFLATEKRPVTAGIMVENDVWSNSYVYFNREMTDKCNNNPDDCGLHSIVLTGYDMDKKVFFFKNSWGTAWGDNGYGTITFETIDRFSQSKFFSVKVVEKINLPEEAKKPTLSLNNIVMSVDDAKVVKIHSDVANLESKFLYASSILVRKTNVGVAADANTNLIAPMIRSLMYIKGEPKTYPLDVSLNMGTLQLPANTENDQYLRTSVFEFTDKGLNLLKRSYLQL